MKLKCAEHRCAWIGESEGLLVADNPFEPGDKIYACPKCKSIDTCVPACDEEGCTEIASGGHPTPGGYRHTCFNHRPTYGAQ